MNRKTIGRSCAAAVVSIIVVGGAAAPVQADETAPTCDAAAISASIDVAKTEVRVAQKAYTTHTKTAMKTLVKQLKAKEAREARSAAKKADRLTKAAVKDKTLRSAAKAARAKARAEAKESAKAQRASTSTLKRLVKADRTALKVTWDAAKTTLRTLRQQAAECEASQPETPPAAV